MLKMEKYLMVVVTTALLCASLSPLAQGMPSRHRRSGVQHGTSPPTESPTFNMENEGSVQQITPPDSSLDGEGAGNSTADLFTQCIEECYNKVLPRDQIEDLRKSVFREFPVRGIHPVFLLSQWLENYHQYQFCTNKTETGCEDSNPNTVDNIVTDIRNIVHETLGHTVEYDDQRYPRYTVKVNCENSKLKVMDYLEKKSDGGWERKLDNNIAVCTGRNQSSR